MNARFFPESPAGRFRVTAEPPGTRRPRTDHGVRNYRTGLFENTRVRVKVKTNWNASGSLFALTREPRLTPPAVVTSPRLRRALSHGARALIHGIRCYNCDRRKELSVKHLRRNLKRFDDERESGLRMDLQQPNNVAVKKPWHTSTLPYQERAHDVRAARLAGGDRAAILEAH